MSKYDALINITEMVIAYREAEYGDISSSDRHQVLDSLVRDLYEVHSRTDVEDPRIRLTRLNGDI